MGVRLFLINNCNCGSFKAFLNGSPNNYTRCSNWWCDNNMDCSIQQWGSYQCILDIDKGQCCSSIDFNILWRFSGFNHCGIILLSSYEWTYWSYFWIKQRSFNRSQSAGNKRSRYLHSFFLQHSGCGRSNCAWCTKHSHIWLSIQFYPALSWLDSSHWLCYWRFHHLILQPLLG